MGEEQTEAREFSAQGLLDQSVLEANKRILVGLLASEGGGAWWQLAQDSYEPALRDVLNRALAHPAS